MQLLHHDRQVLVQKILNNSVVVAGCIRLSRIDFLRSGGDCFFHCLVPLVGMTVPVPRRCVAQHMRSNEHTYGGLGDFELYGGYQSYCDLVATCGVYVEGNAEIAVVADFISRHILILGADSNHHVYIFAGAIGLGAPAHLGVDESPLIIAHSATQHTSIHVLAYLIILVVLQKSKACPH